MVSIINHPEDFEKIKKKPGYINLMQCNACSTAKNNS